MKLSVLGSLLFLAVLASTPAARAADAYTLTDLGAYVYPRDINNRGDVTGSFSSAPPGPGSSAPVHGFLYRKGEFIDLGTLGGTHSEANGLNNRGDVVGSSWLSDNTRSRPMIYRKGVMSELNTPGDRDSFVFDINSRGQVVGYGYFTGSSQAHSFVYDTRDGKSVYTGTLGGSNSYASDINNSGQVVGWSETGSVNRGFLFSDGVITDIGTLGGRNSNAVAINDVGQIAGYAERSDNFTRAFLYSAGVMTDLGTLNGHIYSFATALNNCGEVVGRSVPHFFPPGQRPRPFIYRNGAMHDLSRLIDPASGWALESGPTGINDRGQIVGVGRLNGVEHGYLLTPVATEGEPRVGCDVESYTNQGP